MSSMMFAQDVEVRQFQRIGGDDRAQLLAALRQIGPIDDKMPVVGRGLDRIDHDGGEIRGRIAAESSSPFRFANRARRPGAPAIRAFSRGK